MSWVQGEGEERGEDRPPIRRRNYRTRINRRKPPGEGEEQQQPLGEDAPVSL